MYPPYISASSIGVLQKSSSKGKQVTKLELLDQNQDVLGNLFGHEEKWTFFFYSLIVDFHVDFRVDFSCRFRNQEKKGLVETHSFE